MQKLVYYLTGNSWTDNGAVRLMMSLPDTIRQGKEYVHDDHIIFEFTKDGEELRQTLINLLREGYNNIFHIHNDLKKANQNGASYVKTFDQNGFVKLKVTENIEGKKVNRHQKRNNCIDVPNNISRLADDLTNMVNRFVDELANSDGKDKICSICNRPTERLSAITQSSNPFFGKHHNANIRGVKGSNTYFELSCGICEFVNLLSFFDEKVIYAYSHNNDQSLLLLPVVHSYELLKKIKHNINSHVDSFQVSRIGLSNIKSYVGVDRYSLIVSIYYSLVKDIADRKIEESIDDSGHFTIDEIIKINKWVILPYTSGKNITFGAFSVIHIHEQLYKYVLDFRNEQDEKLNLITGFLKHLKENKNYSFKEDFSSFLVTSDIKVLKRTLFEMFKNADAVQFLSNYHEALQVLTKFIHYYLKENHMLDQQQQTREITCSKCGHVNQLEHEDEIKTHVKAIATQIGRAFSKDVSVISKFYFASSKDTLRKAIKDAFFKLYKRQVSKTDVNYGIKSERVEQILGAITDENWKEFADVFSIYTSLNALNEIKHNN